MDENEIARLHSFVLQVSQRLFLAAEVLSIKAEKQMKKSAWITDWSLIDQDEKYIVCPIVASADKSLYLGQPSTMLGHQVRGLMEKFYVALPMPEFNNQTVHGGQ